MNNILKNIVLAAALLIAMHKGFVVLSKDPNDSESNRLKHIQNQIDGNEYQERYSQSYGHLKFRGEIK